LIAGYITSKIEDQDADDLCKWSKPKKAMSRSHRFSTEAVPQVKLSYSFSVLETDQQRHKFLEAYGKQNKTIRCYDKIKKRTILLLGSSHGRKLDPYSKKSWTLNIKSQAF
jgi:hypothetical protein